MFKLIRAFIGGIWLKVKSTDGKTEYWVHPTCPKSTERLMGGKILEKECYSHCLLQTQF